jgi:putative transposase
MSDKYKMREPDKAYFLTLTVVDWLDVFTMEEPRITIIESLKYCQIHKGLEIYGWCLMPNHMHLIARAGEVISLSDVLRDFKKFTARVILQELQEQYDSSSVWMLARFEAKAKNLKRVEKYKFWRDGNHPMIIYNSRIFYQKLNYIHQNPVNAMLVINPEDYLFSSARNYAGLRNLLPVVLETPELRAY